LDLLDDDLTQPGMRDMPACLFVSDLHGQTARYKHLWQAMVDERPSGVFLGGDLLPHGMDLSWQQSPTDGDFVSGFLRPGFAQVRQTLGDAYPRVFLILGNDDPRAVEDDLLAGQAAGLWEYVHGRQAAFGAFTVYGYSCIPPSPFMLKDWARYDVSRFVDPGCVSPEEGTRTAGPVGREIRYTTIAAELEELVGQNDLAQAIILSHCPSYGCDLDRADLDGQTVDHAPLDVHIGSIALQKFIAERQPLLTLHGHVHESRRLTGNWRQIFGRTVSCNAAAESGELALIRFDPRQPQDMTLDLVQSSVNGSS